jgi:cytochrome c oxidase subunit 3
VFLGVKAVEYYHKFTEHLVPGPAFRFQDGSHSSVDSQHVQLLFSLYFALTGLHAAHMVIGVGLVGVICWMTHRGRFSPEYHTPVEITGLYWHFVDIIWVFLFPLLYLIR